MVKMEKKNVEGKLIVKNIEERLQSTYEAIGWKVSKGKVLSKSEPVKEDVEKPFVKFDKKEKVEE